MKIWHISDTHTYHDLLTIPEVDMVIFTGDCSNPKDPYTNEHEVREFIHWYKGLPIKHKIFIPGNHDTSVEKGLISKMDFAGYNIHILENEHITLDGIKIFGSPMQPTFGTGWAYNRAREKMNDYWSLIDEDTDIVAVHTPPKTILDAAYNPHTGALENCGCQSLKRQMLERVKPQFVCFGHIHNNKDLINAGTLKLSAYDTVFSNGSVVTDKMFGKVTSNGNIFEIEASRVNELEEDLKKYKSL